jgi:hypothetical protein
MRIKSFELFNHVVTVKYVKKIRGRLLGDCDYNTFILRIATHENGEKLKDSVLEHNRWHEQIHLSLNMMGRKDLSEDEDFVDTLAGLLAHYEKSKL